MKCFLMFSGMQGIYPVGTTNFAPKVNLSLNYQSKQLIFKQVKVRSKLTLLLL